MQCLLFHFLKKIFNFFGFFVEKKRAKNNWYECEGYGEFVCFLIFLVVIRKIFVHLQSRLKGFWRVIVECLWLVFSVSEGCICHISGCYREVVG